MNVPIRTPLPALLFICTTLLACGAVLAQVPAVQPTSPAQSNVNGKQESQSDGQLPSGDLSDEATTLYLRALNLINQGKYDEALPLGVRALDLSSKKLGRKNLFVTAVMIQLAVTYFNKGDFARAKLLYEEALAIREELTGVNSTFVAVVLNNLSALYAQEADYPRAEKQLLRVLAIYENVSGVESSAAALAQNNLGVLYFDMGDFARAEERAQKALSIRRKLFGSEDLNVASSVSSLALIYKAKGDYVRAEPMLQEALRINVKLVGELHPYVAASLDHLASLYKLKGNYRLAEELYLHARKIYQEVYKDNDNPGVASILSNLADLYIMRGDYRIAEESLQGALAIEEKVLGPEHPDVAISLNNLGVLYNETGNFARAKEKFQRAREIYDKTVGRENPDYATILMHLGNTAQMEGNYAQAEDFYRQALAIREKVLGKEHPDVAGLVSNMAFMYWKKGDAPHAIDLLTRANDLRERNLASILTTGSEEQKRLYLQTLVSGTDSTISLHVNSWAGKQEAARLALTTILRRKGRVLDAMVGQTSALQAHADGHDRALLDELTAVHAQFSMLVVRGPGQMNPEQHRELVNNLKARIEVLEAQVSTRSAEFRFRLRESPVTVEQVQQAIPAGAALIELTRYRPYDLKAKTTVERYGAERYVAYVLMDRGAVRHVELGDAAAIDEKVKEFRASLRGTSNTDVRRTGRALDELVMRPIRKLLGQRQRLLLAPDGTLNLIPFAALVNENGHFLIENYTITYLTSGRDLLRLQLHLPSRHSPVVIANPQFSQQTGEDFLNSQRNLPRSNSQVFQERFATLSGTAAEAREVSAILGVSPLLEAQATETVLKQLRGSRILHIATHGFFLPNFGGNTNAVQEGEQTEVPPLLSSLLMENPLLRSGLALAGANQLQGGQGEDGILTALEASGLDLWGTKLVVLSACETGLGEVRNGEGVYGLRRAFVLAGTESLVMSLWKVNDETTKDLMVKYYKRLEAGEGRSEALRQVQLEMLKSEEYEHPYYWASFIQSGEWKNLAEKSDR